MVCKQVGWEDVEAQAGEVPDMVQQFECAVAGTGACQGSQCIRV